MSDQKPLYPAWILCPSGCDDYVCTIHCEHVYDCDCPPVEYWDVDPYVDGGKPVTNCGWTDEEYKQAIKDNYPPEEQEDDNAEPKENPVDTAG